MKSPEQRDLIYRNAIETYGIQATILTFLQEMSKMAITSIRFIRRTTGPEDMVSQIALLLNLLGQLSFYIGDQGAIEKKRDEMLDSLSYRIEQTRTRGGLGVKHYASRHIDSSR